MDRTAMVNSPSSSNVLHRSADPTPSKQISSSDDSHNQHQHLRLVLGSILSPKRPCSVSSSSSVSGSASPALPWSIHHHHAKSLHPPDNSTTTTPVLPPPSRSNASPDTVSHNSNPPSPLTHPISHPDGDTVHDFSSVSPRPPLAVISDGEHGADASGQRTPSRKVIATLQSKSAWDVLIHGSMV